MNVSFFCHAVQEMWKQAVRNREPKPMPMPMPAGKATAGPPPKLGLLGPTAKAKPVLPTPKFVGKNAPPTRAAAERQAALRQDEPLTFRMGFLKVDVHIKNLF